MTTVSTIVTADSKKDGGIGHVRLEWPVTIRWNERSHSFGIGGHVGVEYAESFWQRQVADWQASGLTQKAYCEEQGLRYTAFGYWVRKLRREAEPSPGKKPTCFVPVVPATATGLSLALPNGLEIRGIDSGNLPLVRQLLEVL